VGFERNFNRALNGEKFLMGIEFQGKRIAIGVPKTIPVGSVTNVYYAVYCTYKGVTELNNDNLDIAAIFDENNRNVIDYQWYGVPGDYQIQIVSNGTCPSIGPDKAPLNIEAKEITLRGENAPSGMQAVDGRLGPGQTPTEINALDLTFKFGPTDIDTLFLTRWHKPTGVSITDLNLTHPLRDFLAAKYLVNQEDAPQLLGAIEKLLEDDAPTGIQSNEILGVNSQPTGLSSAEKLGLSAGSTLLSANELLGESHKPTGADADEIDEDAPAPPASITAIEVLNESNKPVGISAFNLTDYMPSNVTVESLYIGDEMGVYHPRNVQITDITLRASSRPVGLLAEESLDFNMHKPTGLTAVPFLTIGNLGANLYLPSSLQAHLPIVPLSAAQAPTSLSSEVTIIGDFRSAPQYLESVNIAEQTPSSLSATTNLGFTANQAPTSLSAFWDNGLPFGHNDSGSGDYTPVYNRPWLFTLEQLDTGETERFRLGIGNNAIERRIRWESLDYYESACDGLNFLDYFEGEHGSIISQRTWRNGASIQKDWDCDDDGYFDATSTQQPMLTSWFIENSKTGPFSILFIYHVYKTYEKALDVYHFIHKENLQGAELAEQVTAKDFLRHIFRKTVIHPNQFAGIVGVFSEEVLMKADDTFTADEVRPPNPYTKPDFWHQWSTDSGNPCENGDGAVSGYLNCETAAVAPWGQYPLGTHSNSTGAHFKQYDVWDGYNVHYTGPDYLYWMARSTWDKRAWDAYGINQ